MKINEELIKSLKPCSGRFQNALKYYEGKEFTKAQFMGLKNITQSDKVWVAFRSMKRENIVLCAADIAESVLHIFEAIYPNDDRPRKAIESAKNKDISNSAADAAYAAAYTAYAAPDAAYAANAAAYAANAAVYTANTAPDATYAANAAAYAAAYAASYTAHAADVYIARETQEKLIRKIILKYWR